MKMFSRLLVRHHGIVANLQRYGTGFRFSKHMAGASRIIGKVEYFATNSMIRPQEVNYPRRKDCDPRLIMLNCRYYTNSLNLTQRRKSGGFNWNGIQHQGKGALARTYEARKTQKFPTMTVSALSHTYFVRSELRKRYLDSPRRIERHPS